MTSSPLSPSEAATSVDAAAAAARRVIAALVRAGDMSGVDMAEIAGRLNAVADDLDRSAPARTDRLADMWRDGTVPRHDPVSGPQNPIAPPLTYTERPDGSVESVVTLDLPYQGPPEYVHGGISALLLDHTLGVANSRSGSPCMTAELTLRFRRPTPLFEPLTVTGRLVAVDGRRIRTEGAILADGKVCVSATGIFVAGRPPRRL